MIKEASENRAAALAALKGNWTDAVILTLVYMVVTSILECITNISFIPTVLLTIAVECAFSIVVLDFYRDHSAGFDVKKMFNLSIDPRVITTSLLTLLYIFLWCLLLFIPGIIKTYSYSLVPYILRDNENIKNDEAIELSMKMMNGHKFDLFFLQLTFIGWGILAILSCCIGFLWLVPYMKAAKADFYEDVKREYEAAIN